MSASAKAYVVWNGHQLHGYQSLTAAPTAIDRRNGYTSLTNSLIDKSRNLTAILSPGEL